MKANELRIGNYIELDGKVQSIWEISLDYYDEGFPYISAGDNHIIEFRQCRHKPIPLTEEWLEKFGFQKLEHWSIRIDEYGFLRIYTNTFRYELWDIESGDAYKSWDNTIEYVHQLQNLYFALTGEELIIK